MPLFFHFLVMRQLFRETVIDWRQNVFCVQHAYMRYSVTSISGFYTCLTWIYMYLLEMCHELQCLVHSCNDNVHIGYIKNLISADIYIEKLQKSNTEIFFCNISISLEVLEFIINCDLVESLLEWKVTNFSFWLLYDLILHGTWYDFKFDLKYGQFHASCSQYGYIFFIGIGDKVQYFYLNISCT